MNKNDVLNWICEASQFWGPGTSHSEQIGDAVLAVYAELESMRADAARWNWIMDGYYGGDLDRTNRVIGRCFSREETEAAIDADLLKERSRG